MIPNFLIIGVQKAATSWLWTCLREHPDVFMSDKKEIFFFHGNYEKGLKWYEAHFKNWAGQKAVGEATAGSIYFPEVPGRLKSTLGNDLKFIVSLRHPVDRAYSAFWMFKSRGRLPVDAKFRTFFYESNMNLQSRGYYFMQLSRYLKHFPRESMLTLIYEELKRDSQKTLRQCFDFLDVDSQFTPKSSGEKRNHALSMSVFHDQFWSLRRKVRLLPRGVEKPLVRLGRQLFRRMPKQMSYEPLDKELRQELFEEYVPDIKQLECLLDRDLSIWYAQS